MEMFEAEGIAYVTGRRPLDPAKSTLVFIHGSAGSHLLWQAQIGALAERANTLALDLPGHGRSSGPGLDRVEDYARIVAEFIEAVAVPNPILGGLSLGGAIVQRLLLDFPDRYRAGLLIGTGARLRVLPVILETIEKDYPAFVRSLPSHGASTRTDPELLRPIVEVAARCPWPVALGDFRACDAFDVMDEVASIEAPVLVINAEEDQLTPPKYGDFLEKQLQKVHRVHISEAGHLVPMEKPDQVNRAILEFLDRFHL